MTDSVFNLSCTDLCLYSGSLIKRLTLVIAIFVLAFIHSSKSFSLPHGVVSNGARNSAQKTLDFVGTKSHCHPLAKRGLETVYAPDGDHSDSKGIKRPLLENPGESLRDSSKVFLPKKSNVDFNSFLSNRRLALNEWINKPLVSNKYRTFQGGRIKLSIPESAPLRNKLESVGWAWIQNGKESVLKPKSSLKEVNKKSTFLDDLNKSAQNAPIKDRKTKKVTFSKSKPEVFIYDPDEEFVTTEESFERIHDSEEGPKKSSLIEKTTEYIPKFLEENKFKSPL
ncbi:hypothetical protein BY996DRAFT_6415583 [Phakopsora pachyrhizi]|nr:hypothetical protein BY996DRAFT_6415583 [Phakopsora pachyrhizi]